MRQDVVDRQDPARSQDSNRMRPPVPVLGPFRVQEQQIDTVVGERREIAAAVRLAQVDAPGEAR